MEDFFYDIWIVTRYDLFYGLINGPIGYNNLF
jgi:hypothetical protein